MCAYAQVLELLHWPPVQVAGGRAEHLLSGEQEAPGALLLRARPPHLLLQLSRHAHDQPAAESRRTLNARLH